jgi:hypothetical protein
VETSLGFCLMVSSSATLNMQQDSINFYYESTKCQSRSNFASKKFENYIN